jgi:aspartate ammonia-lyase
MNAPETRNEHDLLGDRAVPAAAYYGVHTLRAVENFPISGNPISIYPDLIRALACIKQAAALANRELGMLDATKCDAIVKACEEIRAGRLHDQFVVDVIQGGAGTSTNMNANEVIANRGLEHLGHAKGEYRYLHPHEHVNMIQRTNDVYPTAFKEALHIVIQRLTDESTRIGQDSKNYVNQVNRELAKYPGFNQAMKNLHDAKQAADKEVAKKK